jgi:hypothetical protein
MPRNLGKVQKYPKPVKWAILFRANPVILLMQVCVVSLIIQLLPQRGTERLYNFVLDIKEK